MISESMGAAMLLPLCAIALGAAVYLHAELRLRTPPGMTTRLTHLLLVVGGIGFATLTTILYASNLPQSLLIGLTSFGVVHIPGACIVALKRLRARS